MSVVNGVLVAIPPPEGYVVDFDNPRRNSVLTAYVVSAVGMVFALLFILQRLYVKAFVRHSLGIDDFLLVIAWLGSIAIQVLTIRSFAHTYMVVHGWEIPFEKFQDFALVNVVILLFLKDMNNSQKWYRWSVCAAMFLVVGSSTGILFSSLFPCQPFRKAFDLTIRPDVGSCIDRQAMFQATASLGVVTDVIIIGIPIPMVLRLHMSKAKKAGLLLMFIIGSALALLISVLDEVDQTWGGGPIRVWMVMAPKLLPSTDDNTRGKSKSTAFSGHELQTFGGTGSYKPSQYKRSGNTRTGP
ncbi:uncharacterized protein VDAG_08229 [Verticillium dahliae VdLs.17]|uniref:Rhodopsin domain-containing protein n=1 Tax=Verticillium dahliae (strain VdLs.17 / ATCC MYA-4575 / FGSC 10137) TaxID=498257 RepID=G2XDJ7_VERDV|nr:uncharacterized protein VDAG_08229 [Verticillium dahliae VdLs.17]EGY17065.1 hypothetical protein VDAG_08229 [Verticillium dahliae VdLs.17]